MLPHIIRIRAPLLLSAILAMSSAIAQTNSNSPQQSPSAPAPGLQVQRIVNECAQSATGTQCSAILREHITKVVSFQVKDFMPGDEDTHVYVVSGIQQAGCTGAGTAKPDESGFIEERVGRAETDLREDDCQHYLIVMNKNSFETRITLDLYEVGLAPFLASLESAMQFAVRVATKTRMTVPGPPWGGSRHQQYKNHRVSIRGDNLTVDEVLDNIYQNSGCIVRRQPEGLMVESCP